MRDTQHHLLLLSNRINSVQLQFRQLELSLIDKINALIEEVSNTGRFKNLKSFVIEVLMTIYSILTKELSDQYFDAFKSFAQMCNSLSVVIRENNPTLFRCDAIYQRLNEIYSIIASKYASLYAKACEFEDQDKMITYLEDLHFLYSKCLENFYDIYLIPYNNFKIIHEKSQSKFLNDIIIPLIQEKFRVKFNSLVHNTMLFLSNSDEKEALQNCLHDIKHLTYLVGTYSCYYDELTAYRRELLEILTVLEGTYDTYCQMQLTREEATPNRYKMFTNQLEYLKIRKPKNVEEGIRHILFIANQCNAVLAERIRIHRNTISLLSQIHPTEAATASTTSTDDSSALSSSSLSASTH